MIYSPEINWLLFLSVLGGCALVVFGMRWVVHMPEELDPKEDPDKIQTFPHSTITLDPETARLFYGPRAPSQEELLAAWHRDCLDLDMDLELFAAKWRGRVPRINWRELDDTIARMNESPITLPEAKRILPGVMVMDYDQRAQMIEHRDNALSNPDRKSGFMYKSVDVTDLLRSNLDLSELLHQCESRHERRVKIGAIGAWRNVNVPIAPLIASTELRHKKVCMHKTFCHGGCEG